MKLLRVVVDVGVGPAAEEWLRRNGHDVQAVRDHDPRMSDTDILAWAVRDQSLVITMDKDFGELVYLSGQAHAGVLLLRLEGAKSQEKANAVEKVFTQFGDQLEGKFSVFQDGRLRTRN